MYIRLHVKYRYSCHLKSNFNFLDRLSKNTQAQVFHVACQAHRWTDGPSDKTKLTVAFRISAKASGPTRN
jgi:hypothetical protein